MHKNIRVVTAVLLAALGVVLAGEVILLKCDGCDHKFSRVFAGCARAVPHRRAAYR